MANEKIRLKVSDENTGTAYVELPGFPVEREFGVVKRTVCIHQLIDGYKGPMVNLDFNKDGVLIGIEILA